MDGMRIVMELKKGEIRPYTAPTLLPEPEPVRTWTTPRLTAA